MYRAPLTSSTLASAGYCSRQRLLELEFKTGHVYRYFEVPPEQYQQLLAAESNGRYFNAHIRHCYHFQQISSIDSASPRHSPPLALKKI
jgi:hypothetical protein